MVETGMGKGDMDETVRDKTERENLRFCPKCGRPCLAFSDGKRWQCADCGFTLYQNVAAAVALILEYDGKILLVERNREPQKGFFALPGGFVDPQESAEDAVKRECAEETGLTPENPRFFCTYPNIYRYKDIVYNTCDLFFTAKIASDKFNSAADFLRTLKKQASEVSELILFEKKTLPLESIAFPSVRQALERYIRGNRAQ